ncbi:MAG TPA: hypothetical protein VGC79_16885 [Polyangiaceae bacterium]
MSDTRDDIDWSKTTFEGSRIEQLRRWRALSIRQRFEALDELHYLSQRLAVCTTFPTAAPEDTQSQPQPQNSGFVSSTTGMPVVAWSHDGHGGSDAE